ncbi:MAG: ComEA family DNA-binding protein [Culicoidibacterales bacterium]
MKQFKQYLATFINSEMIKMSLLVVNVCLSVLVLIGISLWFFGAAPRNQAVVNEQAPPIVVTPVEKPIETAPQSVPETSQSVEAVPPPVTPPESATHVVDGKININTATANLLEELPGIGPQKAQAIIEFRQQTPFQQPSDIMNVTGIGEKTYEKMKELIFVQ